jgi:hypothetical protein
MLIYAGFARVEIMPPFRMPPNDMEAIAIHGYPQPPPPPPPERKDSLLKRILGSRRRTRQTT